MKAIRTVLSFMALLVFFSCNHKEEAALPSDVKNLRAEPRIGGIMLRWDNPSDMNFMYVTITYKIPKTGQLIRTNVSHFADSLLVENLLAKDGEYTFELSTVGESKGVSPNNLTVSATALRKPPVITEYSEKIDFEVGALSANASDPSEGNLANLIDGNLTTFYHTNWHEVIPYPHWIQFDLSEPVESVKYISWNRSGSGGGNADEVSITGSNDGSEWVELGRVLSDELPSTGGARFESSIFSKEGMTFQKIRYNAIRGRGGNTWFHMAEIELHKAWFVVEDPESE